MSIPDKPWFQVVLDLNTSHMPGFDPDWGRLRVAVHEHGFIVFVEGTGDTSEAATYEWLRREPEWIRPAMALARKHDCLLVNFDRDGEVCEGLPTWEW